LRAVTDDANEFTTSRMRKPPTVMLGLAPANTLRRASTGMSG
jgi:hypothetical protein